jgi:hypothetical protein
MGSHYFVEASLFTLDLGFVLRLQSHANGKARSRYACCGSQDD